MDAQMRGWMEGGEKEGGSKQSIAMTTKQYFYYQG